MHPSVMDFVKRTLRRSDVEGRSVLEVGSRDVNGTVRDPVRALGPASYVGVDGEAGPDVDVVADAGRLVETFGPEVFDVVLSTELLEHVEDWRLIVSQMKRVLRPGGILLVTTRSPGFFYHPCPIDAWRYTLEDFARIFADMEILDLANDPYAPGVFLKARKPAAFVETALAGIAVQAMRPPPDPSRTLPSPAPCRGPTVRVSAVRH